MNRVSSIVSRQPILLLSTLLAVSSPSFAQQRPLRTDDLQLVPLGRVRAEFGVEFLQGQRYSLSGLEGDLTRLGVLGLHVGLGEYAEFQISGVVQDFLSVTGRNSAAIAPDFAGNATSDVGDFLLSTKLKMAGESALRPALGFKFGVQIPNASNESGLGTDETNFYACVLLSKQIGRTTVLGNLGLAILGSPVVANSQSDLLTYGLAATIPVNARINIVGEVNGRQGPERRGNENQSQVRVGAQFHAAGLRWDVAALAGLKRFDADSGLALGVTYEFQGFHRKRIPTTVK